MVLVIAGYTAAILILTSQRVRLTRSALPIAIGPGRSPAWRCTHATALTSRPRR